MPNGVVPMPNRAAATIFIFITVVLDMIALGIIAPVLPKLIATFLGGNLAHAAEITGLFATVWALMQFTFSPLLGMLSDRVGRRPVILVSCAASVVDFAIMALAPNLWWLFVGRVLSGMASANLTTAYAYIADVTEPAKRAAAYGMLSAAFGIGFILGPAIGGLAGNVDPRMPFWIAAALSLANTLYGFFVLPESLAPQNRSAALQWRRANPLGSLRLLRRHPDLFGLSTVTFITLVAHEALPNLWVLYTIAQFAWDERAIGLSLALVGVVSSFTAAVLVGPVVRRFGERRAMIFGLITYAIGNSLFGIANGYVTFLGIVILCLSIYNSPMQSLMSKHVGPNEQGELQGAIGSLRGISMLIGPSIFTLTFAQFAGPWRHLNLLGAPFLLATLMIVVALILALRITLSDGESASTLAESAPLSGAQA